jgi:hypothetical protein
MITDSLDAVLRLKRFLQPWYESIADPETAQKKVLGVLLEHYRQTDYGRRYGASHIETIEDFRQAFLMASYEDYKPMTPTDLRMRVSAGRAVTFSASANKRGIGYLDIFPNLYKGRWN